jgi:hypothetical protein
MLKGMLAPTVAWYDELDALEAVSTTEPTTNRAYLHELMANAERLKGVYARLTSVLEQELPAVFGQTPTRQQLNMAAASVASCASDLKAWEIVNLQGLPTAERLQKCRLQLRGSTRHTVLELGRMADHLQNEWDETANMPKPFDMNLRLSADLEAVYALLESMEVVPETDEVVAKEKKSGLWNTIRDLYVMGLLFRRGD